MAPITGATHSGLCGHHYQRNQSIDFCCKAIKFCINLINGGVKQHIYSAKGISMLAWLGIDDAMIASGIALIIYAICGGGAGE